MIELCTINMGTQRKWGRQLKKKKLLFGIGMEDHTPFKICHFGTNLFSKQ